MPHDPYLSILRQYWGYEDFRGIQREIIESIGSGRDTLGLMPTGGGKSITFQVPALAMQGICVVITPLIALMKDQVQALKKRGIKAACIHSAMDHQTILMVLENAIFGAYKVLYVSPERLSSELFLAKFRHMNVSFITIDEAHCICQWGYDFRPSYLQIAQIRDLKPDVPVLALTATATPQVVEDIQDKLHFHAPNVFRMSFERKNLVYMIHRTEAQWRAVSQLLNTYPGSCIIYTRNRQNCRDVCDQLNQEGFSATYYHAGLADSVKDERQADWLNDKTRIMVATNAFGMGIDKPDVRLVLHLDLPDSIEAYFQEAGRAGRDGQLARAIIVMDGKEMQIASRRVSQSYPPEDFIRTVYEKACYYLQMAVGDGLNVTREFNLQEFCRNFHLHPLTARNALDLLDRAGYIDYQDEEEGESRLRILVTRFDLYKLMDQRRELIINCLMRNFCGLFVNYVYLDEDLICRQTGLNQDIVYYELKEMSKSGLIDYIPRKRIPLITFRQRRVETDQIILPPSVYQERKDAFQSRLKALQEYCQQDDLCRSRYLLRYFGEEESQDCGQCDVCQNRHAEEISSEEYDHIRQHLLQQFQHGPLRADKVDTTGLDENKVYHVLTQMRQNGELTYEGFLLKYNKV